MAEMEMSQLVFYPLLFTQFFMSDAADTLLLLPSPFYYGLNFAGGV